MNRGAGQLAVGQFDLILLNRLIHDRQIVVADLVTKPSGSTMNDDRYLVREQSHHAGGLRIENLGHVSNL